MGSLLWDYSTLGFGERLVFAHCFVEISGSKPLPKFVSNQIEDEEDAYIWMSPLGVWEM